jgi:hypothetical protein
MMGSLRTAVLLIGLALALGACTAALAQTEADPFADLSPSREGKRGEEGPSLVFQLLAEIPLPGPLPPTGPRWIDGLVEVSVSGATALVEPVPRSVPRIVPAPSTVPDCPGEAWVTDARGRRRFRSLAPDLLVAEKLRSRGFRTDWRLRSPGLSMSPPLVLDGSVCFGGNDNRITCVKARNGHRIWSRDVGARITRRLIATLPDPAGGAVVLAVLDEGTSLVALSAKNGATLASCEFSSSGLRVIDIPAMSAEGTFAVALQAYDPAQASLRIYSLDPVGPAPPAGSAPPEPAPRTTTSG